MKKIVLIWLLIVPLVLAACGADAPSESAEEAATEPTSEEEATVAADDSATEAYPATDAYPATEAYPATNAYPGVSEFPEGPEFTIDEPVSVSQTDVTGTGPAGVPITLINVDDGGTAIGETTIEEDGTYTIVVEDGLSANTMIALQLGNIEGTDLDPAQFMVGPGYLELPFVGRIFVSTVVQE